ncbi:hypothetical protein [Croceibacterium aestuarii]|uniref:hypothetical protein n=1 Tax=Croceibacterium aestuarii TaxID=3064139 RepID=UPI00272E8D7B|nr:hypothetical protein [Croceibacterium sp. D39]
MTISLEDLHRAIGRVVYEWAHLEDGVDALVFDLAAILTRAFYDERGAGLAYMLLTSNLDLRANIATAKALALQAAEDLPDLFVELDPVLNNIEGELRNERNRFVHDRWIILNEKIVRVKAGSKISRERGSGQHRLDIGTIKEFAQLSEVESVADHIAETRHAIFRFQDQLQEAYRQKFPPEE